MNIFNIDYDGILNAIRGRRKQSVKAEPKPIRQRRVAKPLDSNGQVDVAKIERRETRKINPRYQQIVNNRGFVQFTYCVSCPTCGAKAMQPCTSGAICMERALKFPKEAQRDEDWYRAIRKEAYL
tara:strand:- start:2697 stop:3071 length:375 start_codon:yes stop_codon:yes gene_type:complete